MNASLFVMREQAPQDHTSVVHTEVSKVARASQNSAQLDSKFQIQTEVPTTLAMEVLKMSVNTYATMVTLSLVSIFVGRTIHLQVVSVSELTVDQRSLAWMDVLLHRVTGPPRA